MSTVSSTDVGKQDRSTSSGLRSAARRWTWFKGGLLSMLALLLLVPAGQLTNVGGYMLHIHCTGQDSPTILLEGGLGGTSLDWSPVQPELSITRRVCSYDRAGLGWSGNNPFGVPRTSHPITAELHTLLANTGIEGPYILARLSAGGMHVQVFADRYPAEVLGMVLVNPTPASLMASFSDEQRRPLLRLLPLPGSEALANLPEQTRQAIRSVNVRMGVASALYQEAIGFETSILETASLAPCLPICR